MLLRTSPHTQVAVSHAEGLVRSARSFVYEVVNEMWASLVRGEPLRAELRASFAIAMTHTHRACTQAVDMLYKINGGSSVYAQCPLDPCFRDIHTISQHHFMSLAFDEKAGQVMLGLEPMDHVLAGEQAAKPSQRLASGWGWRATGKLLFGVLVLLHLVDLTPLFLNLLLLLLNLALGLGVRILIVLHFIPDDEARAGAQTATDCGTC